MMNIALTNLGQYNEGILNFTWLSLPATEEEIAEAFDKIQVSHDDKHYYSDGLGHVTDNDYYGAEAPPSILVSCFITGSESG